MLKNETVFVVGAGASAEFDLPVGAELQSKISTLLRFKFEQSFANRLISGDQELYETFKRINRPSLSKFLDASAHISGAIVLARSIDDFIDGNNEDQFVGQVGRLAIARSLIEAERKSKLSIDPSNIYNDIDLNALASTWIGKLFVSMAEGLRSADHFFNKATFIVFNYDRCVEQYFLRALMRRYRLSEEQAGGIVKQASILHPYGTLGSLPWQQSGAGVVEFGNSDRALPEIAKSIKTYTDRIDDPALLDQIRRAMSVADTISFLGFSYQQQNMDLLTPKSGSKARTVLGTAYRMTDFDIKEVTSGLKTRLELVGETPVLSDLTCADFVQNFARAFRS